MKIAIGLSGGVDSSVAAHLLKSQGHEVIGVFMRFWREQNLSCANCLENKCCSEESLHKIKRLCAKMDIPLKIFNFEKEFKKAVVDNFIAYYTAGKTPNPCIWCNEEIKFKLFYEKAKQDLNIDRIATGHYANIISIRQPNFHPRNESPTDASLSEISSVTDQVPNTNNQYPSDKFQNSRISALVCHPEPETNEVSSRAIQDPINNDKFSNALKSNIDLMSSSTGSPQGGPDRGSRKKLFYIQKGVDQTKDQSYFLYRIPQNILSQTIFPLAKLTKSEVKQIAQKEFPDFDFANQKESQDLCFVDDDYKQFISRQSDQLLIPGEIINTQGELIGRHQGLINYTIGQRKGISSGDGKIYYAKEIDIKNNQLIVAPHSELLYDTINIKNIIKTPLLLPESSDPPWADLGWIQGVAENEALRGGLLSSSSIRLGRNRGSRKKIDNSPPFKRGDGSPLGRSGVVVTAKIRYNSPPAKCNLYDSPPFQGGESRRLGDRGGLTIKFHTPQFAPTPGQHCVLYLNDIVVGGGEIFKKQEP